MKALDELRLFEHLARTRHFGRTAAETHVSPSTLSRTIARLEAEVGARLFERDHRSVTLSPEGVRFGTFVKEVLAAWQAYTAGAFEELESVMGTVSLFCTVTASQTIVPEMLARFRATYPRVHLSLETGYAADALDRLEGGAVDVTVAAVPARVPRHLLAHVITSTPLVLVAPDNLSLGLRPTPDGTWSEVPFVLPSAGLTRTLIDRWFRRLRIHPVVGAEATGHEAVLSLVSLGCGIGIVPELVASQSPLASGLRTLTVDVDLPSFDIAACTTPDRLTNRAVAALWSLLTV
ncbi:MAG: HTH-type transcriptional activator IlvY [Acidimicrobiales bacterium]